MPKKPKKSEDLNERARRTLLEATGEVKDAPAPKPEKNAAAVELGRRGGLIGGKARAESLTADERSQIAAKAAAARWAKKTS